MTGIRRVSKSFLKFLSLGLGLGWIVYVYNRNLPLISPGPFRDFLKPRMMGCFEIALLLALWVAAYLIGDRFIEFLGARLEPGMEWLSFASAAGFAILSLVMLLLAATHLLYRAAAWSLLAFPILWRWRSLNQIPAAVWPQSFLVAAESQTLSWKLARLFLVAFIVLVLSLVLLSALGPAIEFDDIAYHLVSGKVYIQQHGLRPIPDNPITFLPKNIEMLFTLGMMLSSAVTAKLIHFLLGLLAILATYALGLRFFGRKVALVAAAVLVSCPIFLWEMKVAHIDAGLALYVFLALYAVVVWLKSQDPAWLRMAVFFLAFSQGIKYHALFVLLSLPVLVIADSWRRGRGWLQAGRIGMKFALYSCLGLIPWGIVNLAYTGNPMFPLLSNVIPTRHWDPALMGFFTAQQKNAGIPISLGNWSQWPVAFWHVVVQPKNPFRGNIGPFCLALIPLLIFRPRLKFPIGYLLGFSFLYYLFWLFTAQHVRYLVPLLPCLSVAASYSLVSFLEREGSVPFGIGAHILGCLLCLMAVFNSPFFEQQGASSRYGKGVLETLSLRLLTGQETKETYLNRLLPNYPVVEFYNQLPGPKKVMFWWNTTASNYYVNSQALWLGSSLVLKSFCKDPKEIHRLLLGSGITHIITGEQGQSTHMIVQPEGEFVRHYLKKLFQKNATILYQVLPAPVDQEFVAYDFLSHVGEAQIRMPNRPEGRGLVFTSSIQDDQRYVLMTTPPAEVEFLLTLGEQPRLRFSIGQCIPHCSGRASFRVWIVANGQREQIYERELFAEARQQDVGWFDEEVDLESYSGQNVRIIFQTEYLEGESCTWYAWADPVIICNPSSDSES